MTSLRIHLMLVLAALALGCSSETASGADAGFIRDAGACDRDSCPVDSSSPDLDSGSTDVDSGDVDSGDVDSGGTDVDSATPDTDAGGPACAGVECLDYAAVLATQPRGASGIENCVAQLHQTDCCGARAAYGINHGARAALCTAETACVASYPDPICSDDTITTDTGETTVDIDNIRIRLVDGVCQTFVCTSGPCRSEPSVEGGCGP